MREKRNILGRRPHKDRRSWIAIMASLLLLCAGCFDTHPYDVDFDGETGINSRQMAVIERNCSGKDTLRVAFISDTHLWHAEMRDEVEALNRCGNIDFVIHCGDMTYTGAAKEYEWCRDILAQLHCPYVALIGNHDFLGTGDEAYEAMYGNKDFAFIAAGVKFICLNTNATEYEDAAAVPNLGFLEAEATDATGSFSRSIVVMHAPPYSDQFTNNVTTFRNCLDRLPGLMCCVYGHNHCDAVGDIFADGLMFYSIDCAEHRNYRMMTITPDGYEMERVFY